jgi:hypothetical protein
MFAGIHPRHCTVDDLPPLVKVALKDRVRGLVSRQRVDAHGHAKGIANVSGVPPVIRS